MGTTVNADRLEDLRVVLVEGPGLRPDLRNHLRRLGLTVEATPPAVLGLTLANSPVHLVVCADADRIDEVHDIVRRSKGNAALVAVADWGPSRIRQALAAETVHDVIPRDLPSAGVAHRVVRLARRAALGEPLQPPPSKRSPTLLRGPAAAAPASPTRPPPAPARNIRAVSSSSAPTAASEPGIRERLSPAPVTDIRSSSSGGRAATERPKPKGRGAATTTMPSSRPPAVSDPENPISRPRSPKARRRATPPPTPMQALGITPETEAEADGSDADSPYLEASPRRERISRPPTDSIPTSVRVPLSNAGQHLGGARIAIADGDITRADAVAVALRARRAEVHLATLDPELTHWRLLRKFAPHAILLDERVLAEEARDFLSRFRHDPFLQHTQLITVRMDRLFRPESGVASVETIRPLLEPLGRAESSLLSKLSPHCEVEFDLDQIPPHMLLKMLAPRAETTRIESVRGKERLVWVIGGGKAGKAVLFQAQEQAQDLDPDDALDWLLHHHNCHVVVTQSNEVEDLSGCDLVPFVEQKISGNWKALTDTEVRQNKKAPKIIHATRAQSAAAPLESLHSDSPPATSVSTPAPERPRTRSARPWLWAGAAALAAGTLAAVLVDVGTQQSQANATKAPASDASTEAATAHEPGPTPSADRTSRVEPPAAEPPAAAPAPEAEPAPPSPPTSSPNEHLAHLFTVEDTMAPSCEAVLGDWTPAEGEHAGQANKYWRRAQHLLVQGGNDAAHVELCKSATLDPAGKGAEHLAQFYLGLHSLERAKKWIEAVLATDPTRSSARELLGDILNQQGQLHEARAQWLEAIGLAADEESKIKAVADLWARHGQRAFAAADYPRAERKLRRAMTLNPSSRVASLLAEIFVRQGKRDAAEAWAAHAQTLD